ncbi:MAG: LLM class flavin-dependent oxidoreductase, partial [Chloroflexota bacterium]|nr:LLM class flavin-dependent oxidoreductase [Chloroflexota bacterium]
MKFSLRLNNDLPIPDYVALAQVAEAAGFDQLWVSNDLFLRSVPVILSAVSQATTRIEIGTCVVNPYTIHPAEIAMLAATLDEISGGRFNLGIAAGGAELLKWVNIAPERPLAE